MKLVYIILAHNQPKHLHRLAWALNSPEVELFIHLDRNSELSEFLKYDFPASVTFLKERFAVFHGGYAYLQAMVHSLGFAYQHSDALYFQFLSGWDYPIKNMQFIIGFLQKNFPMNFINFYPLVGDVDLINTVKKYHFIDQVETSPRILQPPLKVLRRMIRMLPFNRQFISGYIPYRGSCWSCLNRETVAYIVNFLKTNQGSDFLEFFKYVSCPDEVFFQTLILNSPFASSCRYYQRDVVESNRFQKNENKAYLHYIDWNQSRENPAWLGLRDYEALKNTKALYARKFEEEKSASLLEAIDQLIGVYLLSMYRSKTGSL